MKFPFRFGLLWDLSCQTAGAEGEGERGRHPVQIGTEPCSADETFHSAGDELSLWCSIFTLSHPQFHFLLVSKKEKPSSHII